MLKNIQMISLKYSKLKQRKKALIRRKKISYKNEKAHLKLFDILKSSKIFYNSKVIGSYSSINSEIETNHLNDCIFNSGRTLVLPTIVSKKLPLEFRAWDKNNNLIEGKFGIKEPNKTSNKIYPDLVVAPCVAFDRFGNRLGYGGGYYDRTLKSLKLTLPSLKTIILAFDEQEVDKIIIDNNDQSLDYILTEKKLINSKKQ